MKLIVKDRGVGKTHMLVQVSYITGYPIVCFNNASARYIKEMAEKLGANIPEPISVDELRKGNSKSKRGYDKVLVDDINVFITKALQEYLGVDEIVAATCSPYYTEEEWDKWEECADKHERPNIYNVMLDL